MRKFGYLIWYKHNSSRVNENRKRVFLNLWGIAAFLSYVSERVFVNSKVRDYHTVSNFWPVANSYV